MRSLACGPSLVCHHGFLSSLASTCAPPQPRFLRRTAGPLPPSWGNHTAFPRLWQLHLSQNSISGPLPDIAWGQPAAWPNLAQLDLSREPPLLPTNPSAVLMSCDLTAASGDAQCSALCCREQHFWEPAIELDQRWDNAPLELEPRQQLHHVSLRQLCSRLQFSVEHEALTAISSMLCVTS